MHHLDALRCLRAASKKRWADGPKAFRATGSDQLDEVHARVEAERLNHVEAFLRATEGVRHPTRWTLHTSCAA
jgi:hypothetical protein